MRCRWRLISQVDGSLKYKFDIHTFRQYNNTILTLYQQYINNIILTSKSLVKRWDEDGGWDEGWSVKSRVVWNRSSLGKFNISPFRHYITTILTLYQQYINSIILTSKSLMKGWDEDGGWDVGWSVKSRVVWNRSSLDKFNISTFWHYISTIFTLYQQYINNIILTSKSTVRGCDDGDGRDETGLSHDALKWKYGQSVPSIYT